ncbi:MAG: Rieske 2Fe-2S domain-containing protein [Halobacteriovoraceae bacterium]|nr:Rieske 2Fe-2S domain-containing protein [Halobacteriovoraceae bacterium]
MLNSFPSLPQDRWYPVGFTSDFKQGINKVELFGRSVLVLKGEDSSFSAFKDFCPHRGFPLTEGRMVKGKLVCSYHGWKFDKGGNCIDIPGQEKTPQFCLEKVRLEISQNLLWVCLSETSFIEFKRPTLKHQMFKSMMVKAPAFLLMENTLDPMHTPYIHGGLVRDNSNNKKEVQIEIQNGENEVEAIFKDEGKQSGLISKIFAPKDIVGIGRYIHPGILELEFKSPEKVYLLFTACLSPCADNKTKAFVTISYDSLPFQIDILLRPLFGLLINKVLKQDLEVCEKQYENLILHPEEKFVSTRLDYMFPYLKGFLEGNPLPAGKKLLKIEI